MRCDKTLVCTSPRCRAHHRQHRTQEPRLEKEVNQREKCTPLLFKDSLEFALLKHKSKLWKLTKTINNSDLNHKFPFNWVFELRSKFQNVIFLKYSRTLRICHLEIWGREWVKWKGGGVASLCGFPHWFAYLQMAKGCGGVGNPPSTEKGILSEISKTWCGF